MTLPNAINSRVLPFVALFALSCVSGCATDATVIRNVTVIAADGKPPINDATVVIEGGLISDVGHDVSVPSGAREIDGSNKYLIPGLWDMHVHLSKTRPSAMKLLVVNGVTSVRDMGGDIEELLQWRQEVATGARIGPTLYTAGAYLESPANIERMRAKPVAENVEPIERTRIGVADPADAEKVVGMLAARGVDLIKVRESVDSETYIAIGRAARDHGLYLMAHTMEVPLPDILAAGTKSIEHFFIPFLDDMPVEERRRYFEEFADRGIAFAPNMHLYADSEQTPNKEILAFLADESNTIDPRRAYLSKYMLADWREQLQQDRSDGRKEFFRRLMPSVIRDIKEMRASGVTILPSTDTAVVFIFPGWALQEEIARYVDLLDFTPLEAIEAATRESADFMGVGDKVGTISPGKVADLLLLRANPLDDIRNTQKIDAVFLGGRVYDRAGLDAILESVKSEPDVTYDDWGRYEERGQ